MKKTILITVGVILAALLFVGIMLLTDKNDPLEINPTEPAIVDESLPDIVFYEDTLQEGIISDSTAPSKNVKITEGIVVYADGTEKNWLDIYKDELEKPVEEKTFSFVEGTILMTSFNANDNITSVVIPEGIKEFESCFNNNFIPCEVTLPVSLQNIHHTFDNACDLTLITKEGGMMVVIDNVLYTNYGKTLLMYPDWTQDEEYVMPNDVTVIEQEAIVDNPYLRKIVLSDNLESIKLRGIANCANVKEINLPKTLKSIDSSFARMLRLESLNIPKDCELKGTNFIQCPKLNLTVDKENPYYVVENGVLYNKDKTVLIRYLDTKQDSEFVIPDTIVEIGASAFAYNKHLETLTINEGITTVGTFFAECYALTTVNLPESMTTIKTMTFTRLPKLTNINFAGTMEQWLYINKGVDWIISSLEYTLNCSDDSITYKGTA